MHELIDSIGFGITLVVDHLWSMFTYVQIQFTSSYNYKWSIYKLGKFIELKPWFILTRKWRWRRGWRKWWWEGQNCTTGGLGKWVDWFWVEAAAGRPWLKLGWIGRVNLLHVWKNKKLGKQRVLRKQPMIDIVKWSKILFDKIMYVPNKQGEAILSVFN